MSKWENYTTFNSYIFLDQTLSGIPKQNLDKESLHFSIILSNEKQSLLQRFVLYILRVIRISSLKGWGLRLWCLMTITNILVIL
jgi:hypothetical protein